MARFRLVPIVAALITAPLLAGCSGNASNFDPLDWLSADWLSPKPPLPGERKAVFPEGVPGVPQGVPKELVKGSQQQQQAVIEAAEPPPAEAAPAPKPAPKPQAARPAPKPRTASAPPPVRPAAQTQQQRPASQATDGDWPDARTTRQPDNRPTSSAPASQGDSSNWPPPDSSTFSR